MKKEKTKKTNKGTIKAAGDDNDSVKGQQGGSDEE